MLRATFLLGAVALFVSNVFAVSATVEVRKALDYVIRFPRFDVI